MLEGIEILSKTEIMYTPGITLFLFAISFIALIITGFVTTLSICENNRRNSTIFASLCGLSLIILFALLGFIDKPTGKYEYKVTIDDSVSMNEFNERYEIIEVEGKIYTIKEKE
jgi:hypothetical protein